MTVHFRGIPTFRTESSDDYTGAARRVEEWAPICSTRALPKRGDVTTEAHKVTCNDCRQVLRLPRLKEFEDDSDRRHP
jgi:hypothetical protein